MTSAVKAGLQMEWLRHGQSRALKQNNFEQTNFPTLGFFLRGSPRALCSATDSSLSRSLLASGDATLKA
jgi:hypothetical protein